MLNGERRRRQTTGACTGRLLRSARRIVVAGAALTIGSAMMGLLAGTPASAVAGASMRLFPSARYIDVNQDKRRDTGDRVDITYKVHNAGTESLSQISVRDSAIGAVICTTTTLIPKADTACLAQHYVSLGDMNRGVLTSAATATAESAGGAVTAAGRQITTNLAGRPTLVVTSAVSVTEDGDNSGGLSIGDKVVFTFVIANEGTTTASRVAVIDPLLSSAGIHVSCNGTSLDPGAKLACRSAAMTTTTQQAHGGNLTSAAHAIGVTPSGAAIRGQGNTLVKRLGPRLNAYPHAPSASSGGSSGTAPPASTGSVPDSVTSGAGSRAPGDPASASSTWYKRSSVIAGAGTVSVLLVLGASVWWLWWRRRLRHNG
ncbi:MAG: DUF7507 domain-containing protein [Mycobacteriales bacterium]|nr:MAG: hypothetical protein DLM56_04515 [Pseudonocardiales bacterium]